MGTRNCGNIPEKPEEISKELSQFFTDYRCKFLGQISHREVKINENKSYFFISNIV